MTQPTITLVWAMTENGVIGHDGTMPWHLPDDFRRFKAMTLDASVIMGRATWDSLPRRPLPQRHNIVVTRNPDLRADCATVAHSIEAALAAVDTDTAFVIGGATIYEAALPRADRLEVTVIHAELDGDTHMPDVEWSHWRLVAEDPHPADDRHPHPFTFRTYDRA